MTGRATLIRGVVARLRGALIRARRYPPHGAAGHVCDPCCKEYTDDTKWHIDCVYAGRAK